MGRPRTFTPEDAIDKAMELFGERGYQDTPLQAIADRLGVSRSGIYNAFGGKKELFVEGLRRYGAVRGAGLNELRSPGASRAALVKVFELASVDGDGAERCPLIDAAGGRMLDDPEIARVIADAFGDLERCFRDAIERGQGAAEIAAHADPDHTARVLLSQYLGLRILVRCGAGRKPVLESVLQQVQALLAAPPLAEDSEEP